MCYGSICAVSMGECPYLCLYCLKCMHSFSIRRMPSAHECWVCYMSIYTYYIHIMENGLFDWLEVHGINTDQSMVYLTDWKYIGLTLASPIIRVPPSINNTKPCAPPLLVITKQTATITARCYVCGNGLLDWNYMGLTLAWLDWLATGSTWD